MPQDCLFFRILRRFNILWGALVGVALIALIGFCAYQHLYLHKPVAWEPYPSAGFATAEDIRPFTPMASEITVTPDAFGSANTEYGPWSGRLFVATRSNPLPNPMTPENFKNYVANTVVNILVVDAKHGDGAWLFPTNAQSILSRDAVFEGGAKGVTQPETDPRPVLGMVLFVADTDKTGALIRKTQAVYVWTKQSAKLVKLFAADKVLSYDQSGADRYLILYQAGKETRLATYSVPEFKQISDKLMPSLPK